MQHRLYSIRDTKGGFFHPPFHSRSDVEAQRQFTLAATDERSTMSKFPHDFDLYYVGAYNDEDGKIEKIDSPLHVMNGYVTQTQKNVKLDSVPNSKKP